MSIGLVSHLCTSDIANISRTVNQRRNSIAIVNVVDGLTSMVTQASLVLCDVSQWVPLALEGPDCHDLFVLVDY